MKAAGSNGMHGPRLGTAHRYVVCWAPHAWPVPCRRPLNGWEDAHAGRGGGHRRDCWCGTPLHAQAGAPSSGAWKQRSMLVASPAAPLCATGPRESQARAGLPNSNAADDRLRMPRTPSRPRGPPASPSTALGSQASKRGCTCCRLPARVACRSSGAGTRSEALAAGWPGRRAHRRRRRRSGAIAGLACNRHGASPARPGDRPRGSGAPQRTSRESRDASLSHWWRARERSEPDPSLVTQCRA